MYNYLDQLAINSIRSLSIDMTEKANSGHPGMPLGSAPMAYVLWTRFMNHDPQTPDWFNRDRFVLSAGHGSALLYSLLHLSGYNLSLNDLKDFRQWESNTPGHPEFGHTPGVDATTGPLGQGLGMAVGMAMTESHTANTYNQSGFDLINHFTYSICGDGDLMEGVSSEAASLAGHLKLGKLIVLYDSNDISLDGDLSQSFSENIKDRFEAYGWQYISVKDGNDLGEITTALTKAQTDLTRPSLIEVKTIIGYGSPNKAGKSIAHGSPLGYAEAQLTKQTYHWPYDEAFFIPEEVYEYFQKHVKIPGSEHKQNWEKRRRDYQTAFPELAEQLKLAITGELPTAWDNQAPLYQAPSSLATRAASSETINAVAPHLPFLIGGSADLASSNKTMMDNSEDFTSTSYHGRNIWFGVREFAMGAAINGMALHGGVKVFGGTFLVFSDYLRPAIRLAALMRLPVTYVFTHDSIAVGEDGPTHEPIEHLAALRAIPNLSVIRPADGNETVAAWKLALQSQHTPTALILGRQAVPTITNTAQSTYEGVSKGAYIISAATSYKPEALLLASGSEVSLAIKAQTLLSQEGIETAVISMPSWDRFEQQPQEYKDVIFPKQVNKRLAIEMGSSMGWDRYTGDHGQILSINRFGASAPGDTVIEKYGFTVENIVQHVKGLI
ncbi:transketolase [Gracilibacillus phocaeensis]|uniref:transketolase n=1 Tax=Gracilibacillus phocaeensis TaxID=2042304 RepID=UPI001030A276|nr:transketolase [Gracilibacillus phocaeensis]